MGYPWFYGTISASNLDRTCTASLPNVGTTGFCYSGTVDLTTHAVHKDVANKVLRKAAWLYMHIPASLKHTERTCTRTSQCPAFYPFLPRTQRLQKRGWRGYEVMVQRICKAAGTIRPPPACGIRPLLAPKTRARIASPEAGKGTGESGFEPTRGLIGGATATPTVPDPDVP